MQELLHYHFTAKEFTDAHGTAIMLEQQEGIEDTQAIVIHPWQLRAACEHLGIIASDPQAERTIATLQRRIKTLANRIDHLANYLATRSDTRHTDLSYEQTYAMATAEIADEFIAEANEARAESTQQATKTATPAKTAPLQKLHGSDGGQLSIDA